MYTMTLDGNPFFDPRVEEYALEDPIIDREANRLARMTFTIYPDHPCYSSITLFGSMIRVFRDGALMIVMRPIKRTREMMDGVEYECEEWLGDMSYHFCAPEAFGTVNTGTIGERISKIIQQAYATGGSGTIYIPYQYDSHLENFADKFSDAHDADIVEETPKFALDGWRNGWTSISEITFNRYEDLFVFARYFPSGWSIHCQVEDDLPICAQAIEFGDNLKDVFIEAGGDGFFTRLIPLGADTSTSKSHRNNGGANKTPLTIIGQRVQTGPNTYNNSIPYIPDWEFEAQARFQIEHVERWDKIKTASALYNKAFAWFNEHRLRFSSTVRLTALDAHDLNADIDALEFMTRVYCYSAVHGIGAYYVVRKQHLCLADPSQSEIEIGTETPSLTDLTTATARKSSNTIDAIDDRVFGLEET